MLFQGNPIVICNTADEDIAKLARKTIEVPQQVDCLQGILTIIPMQLLSLHIAELRNCDVSTVVAEPYGIIAFNFACTHAVEHVCL